jgi:uncharacterized membrane protein YbhN (UPF0104 family)
MAQFTEPAAATPQLTRNVPQQLSATVWRVAGGLALAHVILLFAAITQEAMVDHGDRLSTIQKVYGDANLTRVLAAGYVEAVSFLVLTAAVVIIARLFGRRTETGRLAAGTFLALGVAMIASTLAVGFPAGAAALYGSQHGAALADVAMVNDMRNFGFYLQVALQAGMDLALGIAALAEAPHIQEDHGRPAIRQETRSCRRRWSTSCWPTAARRHRPVVVAVLAREWRGSQPGWEAGA